MSREQAVEEEVDRALDAVDPHWGGDFTLYAKLFARTAAIAAVRAIREIDDSNSVKEG